MWHGNPLTTTRRTGTHVLSAAGAVSLPCWIFLCVIIFATAPYALAAGSAGQAPESGFSARIDVPQADALKAVHEVAADQIIHGTFSYDKEKILYGAHAADSSPAFRDSPAGPDVFYKVAERVLAPRYFKGTEDIGTITVRYAVEAAGPAASIVRINAVYIDARNKTHASQGNVEAAEFGAIQEHAQAIALKKQQAEEEAAELARRREAPAPKKQASSEPKDLPRNAAPVASAESVQDLQGQVEELRRKIVVRVKDAATQLKSAPFHSASNTQLLPARSEVVVLILTPYWYGVETDTGKRGWVQRSQVESLP